MNYLLRVSSRSKPGYSSRPFSEDPRNTTGGPVKEVLTSDRYADAVRADEAQAQAQAYGISAVPFFVIDGKYGIAGAQPSEMIAEVLERAWNERNPLIVVGEGATGEACADGSCDV